MKVSREIDVAARMPGERLMKSVARIRASFLLGM